MALKPLVELRALCVGFKVLYRHVGGVEGATDEQLDEMVRMKVAIADLAIKVFGDHTNDPCS